MNIERKNPSRDKERVVNEAVRAIREIHVPQGPPAKVVESVLAAGNREQNRFEKGGTKINRIMKIAAVILVVVGIGVVIALLTQGNGGASIAWADVQARIRSISAIQYTMIEYLLTEDGQEQFMKETNVMEDPLGRTRREIIRTGIGGSDWNVIIQDNQSGKTLALDTKSKKAALIVFSKWQHPLDSLSFKERLRDTLDQAHIELGEKTIDTIMAKGYRVEGTNPSGDYYVDYWVNAETAEPIIVESVKTLGPKKFRSVHTDFEFDIYLEESLFSTIPPAGHTVEKQTIEPLRPTADDVVFVLRVWSQKGNELFPDSLRLGDLMAGIPEKEFVAEIDVNRINGTIALLMEPSAHYAGKGVEFGDAQKAIFWYKPKGSEKYKVIYGDLSIKELAEADLPK